MTDTTFQHITPRGIVATVVDTGGKVVWTVLAPTGLVLGYDTLCTTRGEVIRASIDFANEHDKAWKT